MRFTIPFAAKPKARPRVRADGQTYMPKDYTEWKDRVIELIAYSGLRKQALEGDVKVELVMGPESVEVLILPSLINRPPKVRGDLDNLVGGVLDALQDAGLIANDRDVTEVHGWFGE